MQRVLIEKANDFLTYWAYTSLTGRTNIELSSGVTGGCVIASINASKAFNPVGLNTHFTNAKETRAHQGSRIPTGMSASIRGKNEIKASIDVIVREKFSPMQQKLLIALFLPISISSLSQGRRAKALGFKAARASQIKQKAILLVVSLFQPDN